MKGKSSQAKNANVGVVRGPDDSDGERRVKVYDDTEDERLDEELREERS